MGRSRSRDRDRDRDRDRKDKEKKDKKEKRSRSRERKEKDRDRKRSRSREKKSKRKEEDDDEMIPVVRDRPARERSPVVQYRQWRFDSPPKEEEYQRDAMLTGNPMGIGGVASALQGGLGQLGVANQVTPMTLAADTKSMRELYCGNLPAGITAQQLVQFLNQVAQAVKVNSLPGEPVLGATMGGGGLFAFIEFRTAEEAANGLRLNGVELLGCQLKVGRPKGYTGPESAGTLPGQLALGAGGAPSLGQMMAEHGAIRPGGLALPGPGGMPQGASAIDQRLCLVNIPTFVTEDRIKELLITFGQLKFFALQKDGDGKSVGVAFFEYTDMMTQQQARAALEGLELGSKKLSVIRPEQVIELGLVSKVQQLGARVVPCRVIYLKGIVNEQDLVDDGGYNDVCTDIRLECEKHGAVMSIEVPRPKGLGAPNPEAQPAIASGTTGLMALMDSLQTGAKPAAPAEPKPDNSMAIVPAGSIGKPGAPQMPVGFGADGKAIHMESDGIGVGFAFIEFATIEGASKAKKALTGRRFGPNLVEAEYFSEQRYRMKDFGRPTPNTDEPSKQEMNVGTADPGSQLAIYGAPQTALATLESAPVMVE